MLVILQTCSFIMTSKLTVASYISVLSLFFDSQNLPSFLYDSIFLGFALMHQCCDGLRTFEIVYIVVKSFNFSSPCWVNIVMFP